MAFYYTWTGGAFISLPCGKAVCVGKNDEGHAKEWHHPIPKEPLLFIKPTSSFAGFHQPIKALCAQGRVHYEVEIDC